MELYEILGNGFVLLGLLAGSAWIWDAFIGGGDK